MKLLLLFCAVLGTATTAVCNAICTPQQRIAGLITGAKAIVTGDEQVNAMVPYADNATTTLFVQDVPLVLGVNGKTSHDALYLLHQVIQGFNVTYSDNGYNTATITGIGRFGLLGVIPLADVPGHNSYIYDTTTCLVYESIGYIYPSAASVEPLIAFLNKSLPVL